MGAALFLLVAGGVVAAIAIARANARKPGAARRAENSDADYAGDGGSSTWWPSGDAAGSGTGVDNGSCDAGSSDSGGLSDCGGGGDSGGSSGGD